MQKTGILKNVIRRRHSFDGVINADKPDKNKNQDLTLEKVSKCPTVFMDLIRYVYENFKEISQRSNIIELLCNEILKCLDPSNSKDLSGCSIHNTIFEEEVIKCKHIKKAVDDVQKYIKDKKGNQDIDQKIKEIHKSIQSQKLQITVKKKQAEENDKEEEDSEIAAEDSLSTSITQVEGTRNRRDPSPLWDKNIDELITIITNNGKSKKRRGHTSINEIHKKKGKKSDQYKENSPEVTHHIKIIESKRIEHKLKPTDSKFSQKFLFETPGKNMDTYNEETDCKIKEIEELSSRCLSNAKVISLSATQGSTDFKGVTDAIKTAGHQSLLTA